MEKVASNARVLAETLVAEGVQLVSSGTDNHLMLIDLRQSPLSGKDAESRLALVDITVNKNTVPGETRKPMVTSGIRIGTPAITSRGLGADDMRLLGKAIAHVLSNDDARLPQAHEIVRSLCKKYPLYDGSLGTSGYIEGKR
jgi:glycine hydroxymethyltransferase